MNIIEKMQAMSKQQKLSLSVGAALCILFIGVWFLVKPNEQIKNSGEQVMILTDSIRTFYQKKPNAWGLNTYSAIQNKIVPLSMLNGRQIKNSMNKDVLLGADILGNTVMPGSKTFAIVYKNLNKEECLALALYPFPEKVMISIDSINIVNEKTYSFSWGSEGSLPIEADAAQKACQQVNDMLWNIYL